MRTPALDKLAAQLNVSPNQLILAWMLQKKVPAMPVIAASTIAQREENLSAAALVHSDDQLDALENS